jgi:hypothetical protein
MDAPKEIIRKQLNNGKIGQWIGEKGLRDQTQID